MAILPSGRRSVSPIGVERRRRQIVAELAQLRAGSPDPTSDDDDEDRARAARIAVLRNRLRILNGELRAGPAPRTAGPATDLTVPPFGGLDCA